MRSDISISFLIYLIIAIIIIVLAIVFYYTIYHGAVSLNVTSVGYKFLGQ